MFFILYDYSKTLFFSKVHRYPDALFSHRVFAFFEASDLKEVRILSPQYQISKMKLEHIIFIKSCWKHAFQNTIFIFLQIV